MNTKKKDRKEKIERKKENNNNNNNKRIKFFKEFRFIPFRRMQLNEFTQQRLFLFLGRIIKNQNKKIQSF